MQSRVRTAYSDLYKAVPSSRPIAVEYKNLSKRWGWYKVIADLAGDKILDFDAILARSVTEVFTFLQYRKEKSIADEAQYKLNETIRKNANR